MSETGETVNGKVDLGTRRLVLSHVENAASFYAYLDAEKGYMTDIKSICKAECENMPKLVSSPKIDQIVGVFCPGEQVWYRGKVEQLDQGKQKNLFRVRMLDFGWNKLHKLEDMYEVTDSLRDQKVLCEKYKMADLKPKGKAEGYSADDRQRGAEWLKRVVDERVIISSCYKQVNYAGGIMADCMVADKNLNKAALQQGHVVVVPAIIASLVGKKSGSNQQNNFRQNRLPFNSGINGNVDLDYSSYGGSSPYFRQMANGPMNGLRKPGQTGPPKKSDQVKKLEKQIIADKKTINEMKKTTNIDSGIKDVVKLMDRVRQARGDDPEKESKGNYILASLVGVAEVIEQSSSLTSSYLSGVEAVEAAARRVAEDEKKAVTDLSAQSPQSKSDLHKCISQYLAMYSDQDVEDELSRVNSQLTTMNPNIPSGWKLLAVNATAVTRENLLEVAEKVRTWMDESVSRETAATANSKKEVESLCRTLADLSSSLQKTFEGVPDVEVPKSIDSQVALARQALTTELSCRLGGKIDMAKKGKNKAGSNDATVLRSAWKALTALNNQLELSKKKNEEYQSMLTTLLPLMS